MISEQEVKRISNLARLKLTEKEIKEMQKDLSEILDYFNLLKGAGGLLMSPEAPEGHRESFNLRQDVANKSKLADKLIFAFPAKKDRYLKVKAVF